MCTEGVPTLPRLGLEAGPALLLTFPGLPFRPGLQDSVGGFAFVEASLYLPVSQSTKS